MKKLPYIVKNKSGENINILDVIGKVVQQSYSEKEPSAPICIKLINGLDNYGVDDYKILTSPEGDLTITVKCNCSMVTVNIIEEKEPEGWISLLPLYT